MQQFVPFAPTLERFVARAIEILRVEKEGVRGRWTKSQVVERSKHRGGNTDIAGHRRSAVLSVAPYVRPLSPSPLSLHFTRRDPVSSCASISPTAPPLWRVFLSLLPFPPLTPSIPSSFALSYFKPRVYRLCASVVSHGGASDFKNVTVRVLSAVGRLNGRGASREQWTVTVERRR